MRVLVLERLLLGTLVVPISRCRLRRVDRVDSSLITLLRSSSRITIKVRIIGLNRVKTTDLTRVKTTGPRVKNTALNKVKITDLRVKSIDPKDTTSTDHSTANPTKTTDLRTRRDTDLMSTDLNSINRSKTTAPISIPLRHNSINLVVTTKATSKTKGTDTIKVKARDTETIPATEKWK